MTDVMDELYQSFGKTTNVNFIILNWCITDMIMWDRIQVPEDVKQAVNG